MDQFKKNSTVRTLGKFPKFLNYIRQVNGVKLADILFSLLSVCLSVRTQSWRIYALSERLLVS